RYLAVIPAEEGQQVTGQIALVVGGQGADDTEVDGNVLRVGGIADIDKDIARMHVGMEKTVAEYLGKEDLHPFFRQYLHIDARLFERGYVGNRNPVNAFHHQHRFVGVVPVDEGDVDQRGVLEIPAQLAGVGGF